MLGVVEGFYGRQWSWQARADTVSFMARRGLQAYVYAPKGDDFLRRRWRDPLPPALAQSLADLGAHCRAAGVSWGVGLSPLGAGARDVDALTGKLEQLLALDPQIVWLLFDDMRGDSPQLAATQCALANACAERLAGRQVALCPTYYSRDPALERLFGKMPPGYLRDLGAQLRPEIDILWTGSEVCAREHSQADLLEIAEELGRRPLLWDNYPVNDGRRACRFLHLRHFRGRPGNLAQLTAGLFANPMNQAYLSWLPLATLAALGREGQGYDGERAWREASKELCSPKLAELLARDLALFSERGLDALEGTAGERLRAEYAALGGEPMAEEVAEWLSGGYAFDPACLT